MSQGYRPDRVADQIRAEVATMLAREVHDPGIGFLTITQVRVSPDLQVARVSYTTLGTEAQRRSTEKALLRATSFLRKEIGRRLRLRRVPTLEFVFDKSVETQDRVERLLQEIHEAEAARPDENHDPDRHDD
jgi:ribosome-binding factor A